MAYAGVTEEQRMLLYWKRHPTEYGL